MVERGSVGGFFDVLGTGGVISVTVSGAIAGFIHSYVSAKLAKYLEEDIGSPKAELLTMGGMMVPTALWMGLRKTGRLGDSDAIDTVGNIIAGGFLWEIWNGVETFVNILEEEL